MDVIIINHSSSELIESSIIELSMQVLLKIQDLIPLPSKESLSIVFVEDKKMQSLNKMYRGKDKTTDVLSFQGSEESLGDLIFSLDKIKEQALANQHTLTHEYLYLQIHGVLHLLGYDHEVEQETKEMFKIQDQIFAVFQAQKMPAIVLD